MTTNPVSAGSPAPAPPANTRSDYLPSAGECDYYYLFNETIFLINWSEHPGTPFLLDYLHDLDVKPSEVSNNVFTIQDHPLWSESDAGVVLYEGQISFDASASGSRLQSLGAYAGVREDGRARTFFHIRQIDEMRTAARDAAGLALAAATSQNGGPTINLNGVPASLSPSVNPFIVDGDEVARANLADGINFHLLADPPERRVYHNLQEMSTLRAFNRAREQRAAPRAPTVSCAVPPPSATSKRKKSAPDAFHRADDKYLLAKKCYEALIGTWVAVDLEISRADNTRITEVGVVVEIPRDRTVTAHHFVIRENEEWRDAPGIPFRRPGRVIHSPVVFTPFIYGATRHISLDDAVAFLRETVAQACSDGPLYICFHDARTEKSHLLSGESPILPPEPDFDLDSALEVAQRPGFLYYFDTQVLYAGLTGKRASDSDRISLKDFLDEVHVDAPRELWHNAGNDAQSMPLASQLAAPAPPGRARPGMRFPEDVMRRVLEIAVHDGLVKPWRIALLSRRLRVVIFYCVSFWSLDQIRTLVFNLTCRFSAVSRVPPDDLVYSLRAYTLACLGPEPHMDAVVQAGQLLRVIEDDLGWTSPTRPLGNTDKAFRFFDMPYSAAAQSAYLANHVNDLLDHPGVRHCLGFEMHAKELGYVLAVGARMLHRTEPAPDETARVLVVIFIWWIVGTCPGCCAWITAFEVDPAPDHLDYATLDSALRSCAGGTHIHWGCLPTVMQAAAEHILRGSAELNTGIATLLTETAGRLLRNEIHEALDGSTSMKTQLIAHLLSVLRVMLYSEVQQDALRKFVEATLAVLPQASEIALHKNRGLHQILRRVACAALLHPTICPARIHGAGNVDDTLTVRFAHYLLALSHSQPCSKDDWAPHWSKNYEAALAFALAALAAPELVCSHVRAELDLSWDHADLECGRRGNPRSALYCGDRVGMSYMSPVWRFKAYAAPRSWRDVDYGMYPARLWRASNPVWNALIARFEQLAETCRGRGRRKTLRGHLLFAVSAARERLPVDDSDENGDAGNNTCLLGTCKPELLASGWSCCTYTDYRDMLQ
ncbi:hypothetical protein AURDEDRAFT_163273 [Auricularia subglabra TFB-10046 SS5]|nr:hypothetical protein AURDEDRAFT_163273 [Auricularia subglabra TFB-10046 SS5]